jgi:hypothetical protein
MLRKIVFSDIQHIKIGNKSKCNKQNIPEAFTTFMLFVVNDIIKPNN